MKYIYRKATGIERLGVGARSLELEPISKFRGHIKLRTRTDLQLECGHWESGATKDHYHSRKAGIDMYFCRSCNSPDLESSVSMTDLRGDQAAAVEALVRMLQQLGFKIENP